jgi:hypothetical protein
MSVGGLKILHTFSQFERSSLSRTYLDNDDHRLLGWYPWYLRCRWTVVPPLLEWGGEESDNKQFGNRILDTVKMSVRLEITVCMESLTSDVGGVIFGTCRHGFSETARLRWT